MSTLRHHHGRRLPLALAWAAIWLASSVGAPARLTGAEVSPASPLLLTDATIQGELRALAAPTTVIFTRDRQFIVIDHGWLETVFLPHFRKFLATLGPGTAITEGMDCDNYADLLRTQLVIANLRGGGHRWGDVACAVIQAYTERPFGGVPAAAGVLHALIALRTSGGWYVIEPQTATLSPLSKYPNLATTLIVSLD